MTGWVILVDQPKDLPNAETPHKVITTSEYLARPRLFDMARPKLVNLARSRPSRSTSSRSASLTDAGSRIAVASATAIQSTERPEKEGSHEDSDRRRGPTTCVGSAI